MTKRSKHKRSSVRDMVDAATELPPDFFLNAFADDDNGSDDSNDDEKAYSKPPPMVVVATLLDLKLGSSSQQDRPVWFFCDENQPQVNLMQRYPEGPMLQVLIDKLMAGVRNFAELHSDALQVLLGPTHMLHFGFHTSANLKQVIESFETDGFEVLLGISEGQVLLPEEIRRQLNEF